MVTKRIPKEHARAFELFETHRSEMIAFWRDPKNPPTYAVHDAGPIPPPTSGFGDAVMTGTVPIIRYRLRTSPDGRRWEIQLASDYRVVFAKGVTGDTFGLGGGGAW
jgi:hypothetical protein